MAFYHGVKSKQIDTSVSTPVTSSSGVAFVVGAAPIHTAKEVKVNEPILCTNYGEAVTALGYSDEWDKYNLCEVIYSQFKLYGVSPVVFVNVLDPKKHKKDVAATSYQLSDRKTELPLEAIADTVKIAQTSGGYYEKGTDYELFYNNGKLVVETLETGNIESQTGELTISFEAVDPSAVTKNDIIGGFDTQSKTYSGFELVDSVFPKFGIITDLLLSPGYSSDSEVAAVMSAKADKINNIFSGKALIDMDTEEVKHYSEAPKNKSDKNISFKNQILCYPLVKLGDRVFRFSTHLAGVIGATDAINDACPVESPSNKAMKIDSAVLKDGTELALDLTQANFLNSNGIVTALNLGKGYILWGNQTACFPSDTDVKNYFISVSRMFSWVSNSLTLTYWSKIDKKMSRRFVDSIVDSINIWLNGLVADEKLLGGRVEFKAEENSDVALMAGKAVFHVYMTPPSPAQEIEFVLEYDVEYIASALKA